MRRRVQFRGGLHGNVDNLDERHKGVLTQG